MSAVIRTDQLTKRFGDFVAVDHISFAVEAGEVVGYLGPNGSGKTTTIRMLLGLLSPSEGRADVLGFDAFRDSEEVRKRVGYVSQKFALYHDLTTRENLSFYAGVYGVRDRKRIDEVIEQMDLGGNERTLAGELSSGWRQRLALATAIVHSPKLLFLDEPTSGVDPTARRAFWDLIYRLVESGVTALVTTHYMDEAEYCGRVAIMSEGKLLAIDTPSALKQNYLPGLAWDIFADPLLASLQALQQCPCVLRAGLSSDHLRAITPANITEPDLRAAIRDKNISVRSMEQVEPSLEDVFLTLAIRQE
jgi:ABC-2 type transport system ATP-binding protein